MTITRCEGLLPPKVLETMHVEFCRNGSVSFPHKLIRCHRYSTEILLAAAIEEAVEIASFVKVLKIVGAQWACCRGT